MKIWCGVDPGKKGSMSFIFEDGRTQSIPFDRDAYRTRLTWLTESGHEIFCVVERVNAMPGQGTVSMFSFGQNFGWIEGLLDTLRIPYELVTPQRWKKAFGVTRDKNTSISVAKRMFPNHDFKRTERSRVDDDGAAESLLLALFGKRLEGDIS